jgi:hypothetical protein
MSTAPAKRWEPNQKSQFYMVQIFSGVLVGAILGVWGTVWHTERRIAALEQYSEILKQKNAQGAAESAPPAPASSFATLEQLRQDSSVTELGDARPEKLADIIREQQKAHIKTSTGETAWQAFTDDDLKKFIDDRVAEQVAEDLKHDDLFISVVVTVKQMPPAQRQALLRSCDKLFHPTWAQLGRIGPEGTTEAGQRAEILIANAVVSMVKDLLRLSPEQLRAMYS